MGQGIIVEHSIHYASNEYSGKIIDFDEINPVFIGYWQDLLQPPKVKPPCSKRFCYVIHVLSKGSFTFSTGGNDYDLTPGDVFITKPHVPTMYKLSKTTPQSYAWIGFSGNYAKKLDDVATVHKISTDYYSQIVELSKKDIVHAEPVAELLFNLLTEIYNSEKKHNLISIKNYIDENYMSPITIEDLARQFSYNRTYLSQLFKKQYGQSLKEYLTNKRLTEALRLILEGKNITSVSYLVGYNNPYNFSNSFKARYGVSPNKYLKKDSFIKK